MFEYFFSFVFIVYLIYMAIIDYKTCMITNRTVIIGIWIVLSVQFLKLANIQVVGSAETYQDALIGCLVATGVMILISALTSVFTRSHGAIGFGDVKIYLPIGLYLGVSKSLMAIMLSFISGGIISVILILSRLKKADDQIPFGPFIAFNTIILVLLEGIGLPF